MTAHRAAGLSAAARLGAAGLGAAALLRSSFTATAGSARFYLLTTSLAATWTCGALGAGPIHGAATAGVLAPEARHGP